FIIERLYVGRVILRRLHLSPLVALWPGVSIRSAGVGRVLGHERLLLLVLVVVGISDGGDEAVAIQVNVRLLLLELKLGTGRRGSKLL
ncbi:MAG: hypothetical protein ACMG6E_07390, partial [Candidatus Roizmanbacteria bacterium]